MRRWGWHGIAVALALVATVLSAFGTTGTSETVGMSSDGTVTHSVAQTTMLQTEGPSILVVLAVPVFLAALPLLVPRRHRRVVATLSAAMLGVFVFLAMLSVGIFFVPAFIAAVVAAAQSRPTSQPTLV